MLPKTRELKRHAQRRPVCGLDPSLAGGSPRLSHLSYADPHMPSHDLCNTDPQSIYSAFCAGSHTHFVLRMKKIIQTRARHP